MKRIMYILINEKEENKTRYYNGCHFPGIDNEYTFLDRSTKDIARATQFTDSQIDHNLEKIRASGLTIRSV
ncbi:MAG: hypothetical protein GY861_03980 [bacterium]|nr:hypothetical protein [bacterium]